MNNTRKTSKKVFIAQVLIMYTQVFTLLTMLSITFILKYWGICYLLLNYNRTDSVEEPM